MLLTLATNLPLHGQVTLDRTVAPFCSGGVPPYHLTTGIFAQHLDFIEQSIECTRGACRAPDDHMRGREVIEQPSTAVSLSRVYCDVEYPAFQVTGTTRLVSCGPDCGVKQSLRRALFSTAQWRLCKRAPHAIIGFFYSPVRSNASRKVISPNELRVHAFRASTSAYDQTPLAQLRSPALCARTTDST